MRKAFHLLYMCLALCALWQGNAQAGADAPPQSANAELERMAAQLPEVEFFAAAQTDRAYLDLLDALLLRVTSDLPQNLAPALTLRQAINQALLPGQDLNLMLIIGAWLGDYAAVGINNVDVLLDADPDNDDEVILYLAARITNRGLALASLALIGLTSDTEQSTMGDFTVYSKPGSLLALSDALLLLRLGEGSADPADLLQPAHTLAGSPTFQQAIAELPAGDYSAMLYESRSVLLRQVGMDDSLAEMLAALNLDVDILGPVAAGFSIQAEDTLILDLAQSRPAAGLPRSQPIDPDFALFAPAESTFFIQSTDLNTLIRTASGLIASISASDTQDNIYAQFEDLAELLLGLNLQDDILTWTGGDYGLFIQASAAGVISVEPVEYAIIFEVDEAYLGQAQALKAAIGQAIQRIFGADALVEERQIESVVRGQAGLTDVISVRLQSDGTPGNEVVLGVSDRLFFMATYATAVALLNEEGVRLGETGLYQQAGGYALPAPDVYIFGDGRSPGRLIPFVLSLVDPLVSLFLTGDNLALRTTLEELPEAIARIVRTGTVSMVTNQNSSLVLRVAVTLI